MSRSIDFHCVSADNTRERAVAGRTGGLIALHETVTWCGRHFGLWLTLTTRITEMSPPRHFRDEQIKGPFRWMRHDHYVEPTGENQCRMIDRFCFEAPCGLLGRLVERLVLKNHFTAFLRRRNERIRQAAGSDEWKSYVRFP